MTDLHCPDCGSVFPLERVFATEAEHHALDYLLGLSLPVADAVMQYIRLHRPAKRQLTLRKKMLLAIQLQPDLARQAITHKGNDVPAPHAAWRAAIGQMLKRRDAGTLELPLSGHGYLYTILAGLAEKHAATAEQQREQERRQRSGASPGTVTVHGQVMSIGEGVQALYGGKDPVLAALDERNRQAAKPSDDVRERIARITGKKP